MKTLKDIFVIIKSFDIFESFDNFISFDKNELEEKCKELNQIINDGWRNKLKEKDKHKFVPSVVYTVTTLDEAIKSFEDDISDYWRSQDEDY